MHATKNNQNLVITLDGTPSDITIAVNLTQAINLRDTLSVYINEQFRQAIEELDKRELDNIAQVERAHHANLIDRKIAVNDAQLPVKSFFSMPAAVTLSEREERERRITDHYKQEAINTRERETAARIQASLQRLQKTYANSPVSHWIPDGD
jgi:hypothetical protein